MTKLVAILGALLLVAGSAIAFDGIEPMRLGSKSDPEASLFTYDQKFSDTTTLKNYYLGMSAYKDFNGCDRFSSNISRARGYCTIILSTFYARTGRYFGRSSISCPIP